MNECININSHNSQNRCISSTVMLHEFLQYFQKPDLFSVMVTNFITDLAGSHLVEGNHRDLDVNDLTALYNSTLQNVLNQHAPLMQKTVRIHPNSEWFNDHLRQLKLSKRRLETIWKDNQNDITFQNFKIARNFYTSECDNAKRIYFSKLFNDCNGDKRKNYSLIDDLTKIDSNRMYPEENSEQILWNPLLSWLHKGEHHSIYCGNR